MRKVIEAGGERQKARRRRQDAGGKKRDARDMKRGGNNYSEGSFTFFRPERELPAVAMAAMSAP